MTKILVEGRPGAGKTTVVRRVIELLNDAGLVVVGFTTAEIREGRKRVGFHVVSLGGSEAVLAHVDLPKDVRVGRYGVDVGAFERVALPELKRQGDVVVLDELGKMELFSDDFRAAVADLFEDRSRVLATVHVFAHPFTDACKKRPDVDIVTVNAHNRDVLPERVVHRLMSDGRDHP